MSGIALLQRSGASELRQTYVGSRTCSFFPFGHPAAARRSACCCIESGAVLSRQYCWGGGSICDDRRTVGASGHTFRTSKSLFRSPCQPDPESLLVLFCSNLYTRTYIHMHTNVYIMYVCVCVFLCV
jgi:hypothetical protein